MAIEDEELQAREFLKRAEIRTMRKDLLKLREGDSLKERNKIATIKTLEEQLEEKRKTDETTTNIALAERGAREEVLLRNEGQEKLAEKDLKNYATEEERQQIFLFESQRLGFEKQLDAIDKEKDPALKLEKNKILLQKRTDEEKLSSILDQEKKLETEQKFIIEKEQTSPIASQKKGLEQTRWDIDKKIQDVEKRRWAIEKQIEEIDNKISKIDKSSEQLVLEKNNLRDKILGTDKSLRDIYSVVMIREEEKRKNKSQDQIEKQKVLSEIRAKQREGVRRQQWSRPAPSNQEGATGITVPVKKSVRSFEAENEQRKEFLRSVERGTQVPGHDQQQKSNIQ